MTAAQSYFVRRLVWQYERSLKEAIGYPAYYKLLAAVGPYTRFEPEPEPETPEER